jgi:hypothetical protein
MWTEARKEERKKARVKYATYSNYVIYSKYAMYRAVGGGARSGIVSTNHKVSISIIMSKRVDSESTLSRSH